MYEPLTRPVKVYAPMASAVALATEAPVKLSMAPGPPGPLIAPEMLKVC